GPSIPTTNGSSSSFRTERNPRPRRAGQSNSLPRRQAAPAPGHKGVFSSWPREGRMEMILAETNIRRSSRPLFLALLAGGLTILWLSMRCVSAEPAADAPNPAIIRSAKSGVWSSPDTWEGGQPPSAGTRAQIRAGHSVTYDANSDAPIRSIHIAGALTF